MKRLTWFIVFLLLTVFYARSTYAGESSRKDACKQSAELALELFKKENKLFISLNCMNGVGVCDPKAFRELSLEVDVLYERAVAHMHMCLYGSNPKIESLEGTN